MTASCGRRSAVAANSSAVASTHPGAAQPASREGVGLHTEHQNDHGFLHHHFDDMEQQRETTLLGMWSFLCTEIMMFGGLFFVYTLFRWKFPEAYTVGAHHLNWVLGATNTGVLLVSSLTMAMAVHAAAERQKQKMLGCLILTFILGAIFLGIKYVEWSTDYREGLAPSLSWHPEKAFEKDAESYNEFARQKGLPPQADETQLPEELRNPVMHFNMNPNLSNHAEDRFVTVNTNHVQMFMVVYFCMTGLHALHMIVGLIILTTLLIMGSKGAFTNGNDQPVEICGLYWHLIDIIWVFLFPLLYLTGGLIH